MATRRSLFYKHVAQTSPFPMTVEISHAEGMYIYDIDGKSYLDMDSGFCVSSLGHRHPEVVQAIKMQLDKYMHTTVYGEHIQSPQVEFATLLSETLANKLDCIFYANGGAEAVEIAMKLARKHKNRYKIVSCKNAYHGSTLGAESLRSDIAYTSSFVPAVPGVSHIQYNNEEDINQIDHTTACVILEPIQAEAGVILPQNDYLQKIRKRCNETGALMILDEIQTGFGRTGHLFAFQKYNVEPDVLLIAKGMGGGMPIAACMSNIEIMKSLSDNPWLGHINTFGGHPVTTAAALANLNVLLKEDLIDQAEVKGKILSDKLRQLSFVKEVRNAGLMMAVALKDKNLLQPIVDGLREHGAIVDYFLFNEDSFRVAPPLIISENEIKLFIEKLILVHEKLE
jgi:acetylornithine/succinyldiaminopimelate/putrescine aminotransferase